MGLAAGSTVNSTVGPTWLYWAIDLSKVFERSDKRLNKIVVLQTRFTGSTFHELFNGYQPRGHNGYYNSDGTLLYRIEPFVKVRYDFKKGRRFRDGKNLALKVILQFCLVYV